MKRLTFFLLLLFSSIFLLVILLVAGFLMTPPTSVPDESGWMDNMWGCMGDWMSGSYPTTDPFLATYGIVLIVVVGVILLGLAGLIYYYLFPEMKSSLGMKQQIPSQQNNGMSSYDSVLKTLNDDERKVLTVLKEHNGKYLQKYIRHEAKLSRLKTHRILARFAQRGIVTLQKTGNTNEVTLAEWLTD
jgi:hypothetical protein